MALKGVKYLFLIKDSKCLKCWYKGRVFIIKVTLKMNKEKELNIKFLKRPN